MYGNPLHLSSITHKECIFVIYSLKDSLRIVLCKFAVIFVLFSASFGIFKMPFFECGTQLSGKGIAITHGELLNTVQSHRTFILNSSGDPKLSKDTKLVLEKCL